MMETLSDQLDLPLYGLFIPTQVVAAKQKFKENYLKLIRMIQANKTLTVSYLIGKADHVHGTQEVFIALVEHRQVVTELRSSLWHVPATGETHKTCVFYFSWLQNCLVSKQFRNYY